MHSKEAIALDALARALADKVRKGPPKAPRLRLVEAPPRTIYDSITRDSCLRRVRFLARACGFQWLVDQATFNKPCLDSLADEELSRLLAELERARECCEQQIPLEDADFLRSVADQLPHEGAA